MKPVVVVNFKTYKHGREVLKIARAIEQINKNVIVGACATDVYSIAKETKLQVYGQHMDACKPGRNTGYVLAESLKGAGAKGVFLNHSEHSLTIGEIKKSIAICKKLQLRTLVFVKNLAQATLIDRLRPDYLVFEPKELVAGNVSVSKAKPQLIEKISKSVKSKFLVGAGIKTKEDIETSMRLGATGVVFSSVVMKAKNPRKVLRSLL